jgi:translation initiation factor IF-2
VAAEPKATAAEEGDDVIRASAERLSGPKIVGKITLPVSNTPKRGGPVASSSNAAGNAADHKRKRKRKDAQGGGGQGGNSTGQQAPPSGPINPNRPDFRNRPAGPPGGGAGNRPDFRGGGGRNAPPSTGPKEEPSEKDIQDQIKATLARLSGAGKSGKFAQRAKFRRQKRDDVAATAEELAMEQDAQSKVLKVTEFVTANELAS